MIRVTDTPCTSVKMYPDSVSIYTGLQVYISDIHNYIVNDLISIWKMNSGVSLFNFFSGVSIYVSGFSVGWNIKTINER